MKYGVTDVLDRLRDPSRRARARRRGARLRVAVLPRAHAHPGEPAQPVAGRRRPAQGVLAHPRPLRRARDRGGRRRPSSRSATGICLVDRARPDHHSPRRSRRLDSLSNGRLLFGIGGGWNAEEMENHGTDFKTRWTLLRERIAGDEGDLDQGRGGVPRRATSTSIRSGPGRSRCRSRIRRSSSARARARGRQRVVDYCDGWMPIAGRDDVLDGIADLRVRAPKRRDAIRRSLSVTIFGAPAEPERLEQLSQDAGVERVVFGLPPADRDTVLPIARPATPKLMRRSAAHRRAVPHFADDPRRPTYVRTRASSCVRSASSIWRRSSRSLGRSAACSARTDCCPPRPT